MATAAPLKFGVLQSGRFVAALVILSAHADQAVRAFIASTPPSLFASLEAVGFIGLQYFFVLSGFIIYFANARRAAEPGWSRRFLAGRLKRIYLPYLPIGVGMAAAYTLLPGLSESSREWSWFTTLTLLPSGAPPALNVAWALEHEILFYGFAALFLGRGRFLAGALGWGAAIVAWNAVFGLTTGIFLRPMNLDFLFGAAAAWCVIHRRAERDLFLAAGGAAALAAHFLLGWDESPLAGLALALLLVPLARLEARGVVSAPRALIFLGDASFSIFLIHWPVVAVIGRVLGGTGLAWPLAMALIILAGILAGIFYHLWFERRLLAKLEGRSQPSPPASVPSDTSASASR